jgi:hypothetical protein
MASRKRGRPAKPKKPEPPAAEVKPSVAAAVERMEAGPDKPMSNAERQKAYRERHKKGGSKSAEAVQVIEVDDGDIQVAAEVGGVLWDIVGPFARLRSLDESQRLRLGRALAPLIKKYLPLLADWQYEAAALLCVMALARETRIPKEPKPGEEAAEDAGLDGSSSPAQ